MSEEITRGASDRGAYLGLCVLLALAAFFGGWAAVALGEWLASRPDWSPWGVRVEWATATVGLGVVIALAREVLQVLVDLPSHAAPMKFSNWASDGVRVFFAVGGCVLAFVTFKAKDPAIIEQGLPLIPAYPVVVQAADGDVLAVMPLFYKQNAKEDGANGTWATGVEINDTLNRDALLLLRRLVERLSVNCAPSEPSQGFRLSTVGYASSAEFLGREASSDNLNLAVSNARASSAYHRLAELTSGRKDFRIEVKTFGGPGEMFAERAYLDRVGGKTTPDQEYLNRRVEVRLHATGSCTSRERLLEVLR